jgi:hypothetical protein
LHHSLHICFKNIRKNSHTNIQLDGKTNAFSHIGEFLLQNIRFEANIRKSLSEFHIQANSRLKIFAFQQQFACKY